MKHPIQGSSGCLFGVVFLTIVNTVTKVIKNKNLHIGVDDLLII